MERLTRLVGGVLLAIGAVVAVPPIIEPLYHVSSAASPYSPMWRIMDPLAALAVVLGVIGGYSRTRRVAHDGAAPITREWLAANALCYGFLVVGILFVWNWFTLLRPACTAVGTDTSDVVWGFINAALPLLAGTLGLALLRGDTSVPRAGSSMHECRPPSRRGRRRSAYIVTGRLRHEDAPIKTKAIRLASAALADPISSTAAGVLQVVTELRGHGRCSGMRLSHAATPCARKRSTAIRRFTWAGRSSAFSMMLW